MCLRKKSERFLNALKTARHAKIHKKQFEFLMIIFYDKGDY